MNKIAALPIQPNNVSDLIARNLMMSVLHRSFVELSLETAILHQHSYQKKFTPVSLVNSKGRRTEDTSQNALANLSKP
jgi:hypothetical protein